MDDRRGKPSIANIERKIAYEYNEGNC